MMNLYGLGVSVSPEAQSAINGFLSTAPDPSSSQITDFLKLYPQADRALVAQGLIAAGVDSTKVSSAAQFLAASGSITKSTIWGLLALVSAGASGYHGVRRNHGSIGWGAWWFFMGGLFPIFTPIISIAQGFATPKSKG